MRKLRVQTLYLGKLMEKKYLLELEKFTFVFGEKLTFNPSCQLEASISVLGGLSPDFDAFL